MEGKSVYEKKWSFFQIVMIIVCVLLMASILAPIFNIVATSLSGKHAIAKGEVGIWPVEFTWEGYEMVFANANIVKSMFYSLALTLVSTFLSTFFTICAAYPLSKTWLRGRTFCLTLITITMYVSAGTIPSYLLVKNLGLLNTVWALIVPHLMTPFNLIILRTFFQSISPSLFEAAQIDGCGEWGCMFKIAIPLSLPSVLTVALFYAVSRWNNVTDVMYYTNKTELYTLQYHLKLMLDTVNIDYTKAEQEMESLITPENLKSATIVFAMVPMMVVYPFVQKYFTQGMNMGGVKE